MTLKYRIECAINTCKETLVKPLMAYKEIHDAIMFERNFVDMEAVEINEKFREINKAVSLNKTKLAQYNNEFDSLNSLAQSKHSHLDTPLTEAQLKAELNRIKTNISTIADDLLQNMRLIIKKI